MRVPMMLVVLLISAPAAALMQPQDAPLYHPNGPTYCGSDGTVIWWRWRADESGDPVYNVLLVRNGKPTVAMSAFSFQPVPHEYRDTFIFAILPKGEPGHEVLVTRLSLVVEGTEYSSCSKPTPAGSDLRGNQQFAPS